MIDAVIFDMDGLLIDSEPFWVAIEIEVFATLGVILTPHDCETTTGMRIDAVVQHWFERSPWTTPSCSDVTEEIIRRVAASMQYAQPLPGVYQVINEARARNLQLALCSSSPYVIIYEALKTLGLSDTFLVHSAQEEKHGKPHPAAYMATAERLGVAYNRCLVFEDSLNGAIAAKAASMKVVAVPQGDAALSTRFDFCDAKLLSLTEFDGAYFDRFGAYSR
jgi:HAD superfamily hydrolase (TIGR01509 family)